MAMTKIMILTLVIVKLSMLVLVMKTTIKTMQLRKQPRKLALIQPQGVNLSLIHI